MLPHGMTTHLPQSAQTDIGKLMGLTAQQIDTTLQLICLAENAETGWWKHYNYIERLGDGRGYTVTLYGACSGTGDLLMIFDELAKINPQHPLLKYHAALRKCRGEDVKGIEGLLKDIPALGEDEEWKRAVWAVYLALYWRFAAAFASKTKECEKRPGPALKTPLAKGFMVDTAINHGADMDSFKKILKRMQQPEQLNETAWLTDFMKTRQQMLKRGVDDLDTSRTGDRCKLWRELLKAGNTQLALPIQAFEGYWGKKTLR